MIRVVGERFSGDFRFGSRPAAEQSSILARRIHGALEHFKYRNSVPEVQGYLSSQAEIDASGVDGGYSLMRSIIWAVPILGFIGTVQGISSAVTHLKKVMPSATAVEKPGGEAAAKPAAPDESVSSKLMGAMGGITSGLATAFDTTLVALSFAIFRLFLTEWLRKTEYATLDRIEQFTNEALLRRMQEKEGAGKDIGEAPGLVR